MIFSEIVPEDCGWVRSLVEQEERASCEFVFVNMYMWKKIYNTQIARFEDFVIARSSLKRAHYLYPAGSGDRKKALDVIIADAEEIGKEPVLFSLNQSDMQDMEEYYPGKFNYSSQEGQTDYIYLATDLAELKGRKFQKKRNFCSRFERENPNWEYCEIEPKDIKELCEFNNIWCNLYDNRDDEGIAEEHLAVEQVLRHFGELCVQGGYIRVDGKIVAFSFGSRLGRKMFVTHVEKALYSYTGAYNIINREMAKRCIEEGFEYINRENDVDEEGLRKAKLSYNPVKMEEKFVAEIINNSTD